MIKIRSVNSEIQKKKLISNNNIINIIYKKKKKSFFILKIKPKNKFFFFSPPPKNGALKISNFFTDGFIFKNQHGIHVKYIKILKNTFFGFCNFLLNLNIYNCT